MHNAKSREHAHTCRKARAIFRLRYKNKNKNKNNHFEGSLDLTQLPTTLQSIQLCDNIFSGTIDLGHLPLTVSHLSASNNNLSGTLRVPPSVQFTREGNTKLTLEFMPEKKLF